MEVAFALLFLLGIYIVFGYFSRAVFIDIGESVFGWEEQLNYAAAWIAAFLWPLAWPALAITLVSRLVWYMYSQISASFKLIAKHIEESMRGNK